MCVHVFVCACAGVSVCVQYITCKRAGSTAFGGYLSDGTRLDPHKAIDMKNTAPRNNKALLPVEPLKK